jgi:hypothetical protein
MLDILELGIMVLILAICGYVIYRYKSNDPYLIIEGKKNKKNKKNNKNTTNHKNNAALNEDDTDAENAPPTAVVSGIAETSPMFINQLNTLVGASDVELRINTFYKDYIDIIDIVKDLLYRRALKSCLEYTPKNVPEMIAEINGCIQAITNLDKVSTYVSDPDTALLPSNTKTQKPDDSGDTGTSTTGWFGS